MIAVAVFFWLADHAPVICGLAITAAGLCAVRYNLRRCRHLPAAPDNVPPTDTDDLWTCRRILAEPLADPDATRRLINYLRDNGEEDTP